MKIIRMKIRFIFILVFIFNLNHSYSQEDKVNKTLARSIYFAPELNGLILAQNSQDQNSKSSFGFSLGGLIDLRIYKGLSFRTGIGYGLNRYRHYNGAAFLNDFDTITFKLNSRMNYSEIHIPLSFMYGYDNSFFVTLGMELAYQFQNNSSYEIVDSQGNTSRFNYNRESKLNFAPNLSFGNYLSLNRRHTLSAELFFKLYLREYQIPRSNFFILGLRVAFFF